MIFKMKVKIIDDIEAGKKVFIRNWKLMFTAERKCSLK
jgi:hypothetical protein